MKDSNSLENHSQCLDFFSSLPNKVRDFFPHFFIKAHAGKMLSHSKFISKLHKSLTCLISVVYLAGSIIHYHILAAP